MGFAGINPSRASSDRPHPEGGALESQLAISSISSILDEMKTFTANEAKQKLGLVLDTARTGPVTITKHGRPEFVLTSKENYDSLAELKYKNLRQEVSTGFEALDRGEFSTRTFEEIAEEAFRFEAQSPTE